MNKKWYRGDMYWKETPAIKSGKKGTREYGPGMYFTSSPERARKWAREPRTVMEVEVGDLRLLTLKDVEPTSAVANFAQFFLKAALADEIREGRDPDEPYPLWYLMTLAVHHEVSHGRRGERLREYLLTHGIEGHVTEPSFSQPEGEKWLLLFDPSKIVAWRRYEYV